MSAKQRIFKGHKTLLGHRYVTLNELELSPRFELFNHARDGFDWGYMGSGPLQLAFCILYEMRGEEFAKTYKTEFAKDVIKNLPSKNWILESTDINPWIKTQEPLETEVKKKKKDPNSTNVVKEVCKDLGITQKKLAKILEIPEGTVSSWAVKNEIPRLGKKAIEFYQKSKQNQEIVDKFRELIQLVNP